MLPFKKGPFVLAIRAGVPVVPVLIRGGFENLPKGSIAVRGLPMSVNFGEPIPTAGLTYEDRDALSTSCRAAMEAMKVR
jgi:1-acyl-sn-glycerol-3-phosphate acyltransferase